MELIIKPTGLCNFDCTFCSAYGMDIKHPADKHVPDVMKNYIRTLKPERIVITGGEPLMVDPEYYYELHEVANCNICPTSNLKDFYFHPEKWEPLFTEPWFRIGTSFNYGESRRWDKDTPFTEEMFIKVIEKIRETISDEHQMRSFIAVIDEHNEDRALDHVYLAKKLNMRVKLNGVIGVGRQDKTYPRYKMFKWYLDIIELGLDQYEANCLTRGNGMCPRNIHFQCNNAIRACYVDNAGKLHVGVCDERLTVGDEMPPEEWIPTKIHSSDIPKSDEFITPMCEYCDLCRLCNGCKVNRMAAKRDPNYCTEMLKLKDRIIETGWAL